VLGASLVVAIQCALRIEAGRTMGTQPTSPHVPGFDRDAWSALQTMLCEERRLIEFLVGPKVRNAKGQGGARVVANPDDICIMCFATAPNQPWEMSDGVRSTLRGRASRVNKRISPFAGVITPSDARTEQGTWQTGYLRIITTELAAFLEWLYGQQPDAARALDPYVVRAQALAEQLPPPLGDPWFAD
jgi:hypothetical protein